MRRLGSVCVLALMGAAIQMSPAMAQQSGSPMADLLDKARLATRPTMLQWSATRPAALAGISKKGRDWMGAEVQRQATAPRRPIEIAIDIDKALAKDIHRMAKDKHVHEEDISGALLIKLLTDTKIALMVEARKVAHAKGPAAVGPEWTDRIALADANRRTAIEMQSDVSLALARD